MIVLLIALGPNGLKIPCRVFGSLADGVAFCNSRWGEAGKGGMWRVREDDEKVAALFTSYYDGCGGVGGLVLKEVPYDSPFLAWSLD